MTKLNEKVAVITGGASGIGEATVRLFIEEGARVVIGDIQAERGNRLSEELGDNVSFKLTDVREESDVKALINHAKETHGRLDCLFNNAGFAGVGGPIESIPVPGWDQTIAVLLRGVFLGMKHAAPIMKSQGEGSIINTASISGLRRNNTNYPYSAAKAAVIQLTRAVAMELGEFGIRVNCICPGAIITPIFGKAHGLPMDVTLERLDRLKPLFKKLQPIPRAGLPKDIAKAVLWLASDDSSFVNGHSLVVDGGQSAGQSMSNRMRFSEKVQEILGVEEFHIERGTEREPIE